MISFNVQSRQQQFVNRSRTNFAGLSQVCAVLLLFFSQTFLADAATVINPLEPQYVKPGEALQVAVRLNRQDGVRVQIKLMNAPEGLKLGVNSEGEFVVLWETPTDLPVESLAIITANDVDSGEILDRRYLLIRNSDDFPDEPDVPGKENEPSDTDSTIAEKPSELSENVLVKLEQTAMDDAVSKPLSANPAQHSVVESPSTQLVTLGGDKIIASAQPQPQLRIHIDQVSNQIVSTGRTVVLNIGATASDNVPPIMEVDRLPMNASFEKKDDGVYTLFWPTGDPDQGEHLFRFTARHPDRTSISDSHEVMIVVGDPARSKTRPLESP